MTRRQAVLALWATCLIWGVAFPLVKLVLPLTSPMAFTALRFLVAGALLLPRLGRVTRDEWRAGGLLGLLLAAGFATQTVGLTITTASRSGFITALYIPFTPLIVLAAWRTLPGRWATLGLAIAVSGMILLTRPDDLGGGFNRGDMLTLLCALCFASHMVATGLFARRHALDHLMMAQIVVAAVVTTVVTPFLETPRFVVTPLFVGVVAYEALLASIVAIRLQLAAQRVVSATSAALIYTLEPVVAALASFLLLGDRLDALQWLGGILILGGSLLPEFRRPPRGSAVAGS